MSDILELIDNAIDDYISGDAMRWTPEPPAPRAHRVDQAHQLTPWQQETVSRVLRQTRDPIVVTAICQLSEAIKGAAAQLGLFDEAFGPHQAEKRARISRMHVAYRQRH